MLKSLLFNPAYHRLIDRFLGGGQRADRGGKKDGC
jgi:hypothetical protein